MNAAAPYRCATPSRMEITRRNLLRTAGLAASATMLNSEPKASGPAPAPTNPPAPAAPTSPAPVDISDYTKLAPSRMTPLAWEYMSGGAADELTLHWNEEAYRKIRLRPNVLVDVSKVDTRITLLGQEMPHPIFLAPAAYHKLLHPEGELATARGAAAAGATFVLSTTATTSIEDVAKVATKPLWFQLYVQPDREFTRDLVKRAEASGYKALVVTVDTSVLGPRYRETRTQFTLPPGMERATRPQNRHRWPAPQRKHHLQRSAGPDGDMEGHRVAALAHLHAADPQRHP